MVSASCSTTRTVFPRSLNRLSSGEGGDCPSGEDRCWARLEHREPLQGLNRSGWPTGSSDPLLRTGWMQACPGKGNRGLRFSETRVVRGSLENSFRDGCLFRVEPEVLEEVEGPLDRQSRHLTDGESMDRYGKGNGLEPGSMARGASLEAQEPLDFFPDHVGLGFVIPSFETRDHALKGPLVVLTVFFALEIEFDFFFARAVKKDLLHFLGRLL